MLSDNILSEKSDGLLLKKKIMHKLFILSIALLLFSVNTYGQSQITVAEAQEQMDSILLGQRQLPSMLIVGSFHLLIIISMHTKQMKPSR